MSRGSQQTPRSAEYGILLDLLRESRLASGLSQKEICDRLGKPRNYLIKVEGGERRLDVVELFTLCRAMGTDPLVLLNAFASRLPR
ncbi:MAG: XRE family transcriptional regulator [Verrucomicrobiaceae bacterium]|nr:MAG: XRE family transcriptional regulator [Verrucomicrobiaceae bacterium]